MKRIVLSLTCLLCLLLAGPVLAAQVYMDVPSSVNVGQPLEVNGTTTGVQPGYNFDVVFYYTTFSKKKIAQKAVVIQEDGTFNVVFSTDGLKSGQYSVEISESGDGIFGGTKRPVILTIVNRTADLTLSSAQSQEYDGVLLVAGSIKNYGNSGVRLTVRDADENTVYGPEWITTQAGAFSKNVPIRSAGKYTAEIMDNTSYVWTVDYTVTGGTTTITPTGSQTAGPTYSASAPASRGNPAYFVVDTLGGPVTISTSTGIDWVLEYIDEKGQRSLVNNQGTTAPETVTLQATGGVIYVKVTPQLYTETGTVTVSAENVKKISVDATVAGKFGDPVPTTAQSPVPLGLVLLALGAIFLLFRKI